ncbi:hypothetical protein SuNHUV7_41220 (plasmid) [Pseudoseohaeicola sp. NH-UV-7]
MAAPSEAATTLVADAENKSTVGRSFTYSAGVYALHAIGGYGLVSFTQGLFVSLFIFALIDDALLRRPLVLFLGLIALATATTLPWFVVYLMPDIFAAVPILFGILLIGPLSATTGWQRWFFAALSALAVSFHYGYPPLMAGVTAVALLCLMVRGSLTPALGFAALLPVVFAPLLNLAASSAVLDNPSATPLRLPILLARSLEDGPALWYLTEACPEANLAFCDAFGDDIPAYVGSFLWDEDGISKLSREQMAQIREEEFTILWRAFRAYPIAQTTSLLGNAAKQSVKIGTGNISGRLATEEFGIERLPPDAPALRALQRYDTLVMWTSAISAAICLGCLCFPRVRRRHGGTLLIVLSGLLANAVIFGGLSAPVERYQSRVIWLLSLMAVLMVPSLFSRGGPR